MRTFRVEEDSMGQMQVPESAYYGTQTARAVENFPISGLRFPRSFIRALGLIKKHAARVNGQLGLLPAEIARAIHEAAAEVVEGKLDAEFVVDIFQTGSGTSTNMNANEVVANRAGEILGHARGSKRVHPNDHVNLGQSSNDVIPSAIHICARERIAKALEPALENLSMILSGKGTEFRDIFKIGRTHLQDATPIRLGQEFSGYAAQVRQARAALHNLGEPLGRLALGGTAVGTGLNTHRDFAGRVIAGIGEETEIAFHEAENHFAAQGAVDACVVASGTLKGVAIALIKIANDIRWLGSGPRCGLGELRLPPMQPGSSIMPGKVNPVMSEMVIQVGAQVIGNDAVIAFSGTMGAFELNTMLPVIAWNLLQSIELLANSAQVFAERCVRGVEADIVRCAASLDQSLALVTGLVPAIGYDRAAEIAKEAYTTGRTIREVARERAGIEEDRLKELLDPVRQAGERE